MITELDSDGSPVVSSSSDYIDITDDDEIDSIRVHSVLFGNAGPNIENLEPVADVEFGQIDGNDVELGTFEGSDVELGQVEGG
ncbi:hypothetical protein ACJIZ3_014230 [Penstemon smallii]|uniref:Uncharacterized protein n=1 Tax=Penstemon smallii TaxID=265156 RepID=A0ABD3RKV8_9LAMI